MHAKGYLFSVRCVQDGGPGPNTEGPFNLTININPPAAKNSGVCSVTQPQGGLGSYSYDVGSSITVTASSSAPYEFYGWVENSLLVSDNRSYTFTIYADRNLSARFLDTTSAASVKYCRWNGDPENCWTISSGGEVKTEVECLQKAGEVVSDCYAAPNGVYCSYPASTTSPASCSWKSGTSAAPAADACIADAGAVVSSCP